MTIFSTPDPLALVHTLQRHDLAVGRLSSALSSGLRIRTAADDAAGLASSARLGARIRSWHQADRNVQDGISLLHLADGALDRAGSLVVRMRELATEAASDAVSHQDRATLEREFSALREEIDRIVRGTSFDGIILLDGSLGTGGTAQAATFTASVAQTQSLAKNEKIMFEDFGIFAGVKGNERQIMFAKGATQAGIVAQINSDPVIGARVQASVDGSGRLLLTSLATGSGVSFRVSSNRAAAPDTIGIGNAVQQVTGSDPMNGIAIQAGIDLVAHERIGIVLESVLAADLGIGTASVTTRGGALAAMTMLDSAQQRLSETRGQVGALVNRLAIARRNLATSAETGAEARSRIRDLDMAAATSDLVRKTMLQQGTVQLFRRSNEMAAAVLQLLQRGDADIGARGEPRPLPERHSRGMTTATDTSRTERWTSR